MSSEKKEPFPLKPSIIMAVVMGVFAFGFDALQMLLILAIPGAGILLAWCVGFFAYIVFYIWFTLVKHDGKNHFVLVRTLVYLGSFLWEFIPGVDFFPLITVGVVARILITWMGIRKANKLAKREAEAKDLSARDEQKLARRWNRVDPQDAEQKKKQLAQTATDEAQTAKERRVLEHRREEKAKNIGMKAAAIVAPEVALPVKAGLTLLEARKNRVSAKKSTDPSNGTKPFAGDIPKTGSEAQYPY